MYEVFLYLLLSIVILIIGHNIIDYCTSMFSEEIVHNLHHEKETLMKEFQEDLTTISSNENSTHNVISEDVSEKIATDELEDFMENLEGDEATKLPDPTIHFDTHPIGPQDNENVLEFNSGEMEQYTSYKT